MSFVLTNGTKYRVLGGSPNPPLRHIQQQQQQQQQAPQPQQQQQNSAAGGVASLRIATINVSFRAGPQWLFPRGGAGNGDHDLVRNAIFEDMLLRSEADILCLQESVFARGPSLPAGGQAVYIRSKNAVQTHCPGNTVLYLRQSTVRVLAEGTCRPLSPDPDNPDLGATPAFSIVCLSVKNTPVVIIVASVHLAPFAEAARIRQFQLCVVWESMRSFAFDCGVDWNRTLFLLAGDMNMQTQEMPAPRLGLLDLWLEKAAVSNRRQRGAAADGNSNNSHRAANQADEEDPAEKFGPVRSATFADPTNDFNFNGLCEMRNKFPRPKNSRYDRIYMFSQPQMQAVASAVQAQQQQSGRGGGGGAGAAASRAASSAQGRTLSDSGTISARPISASIDHMQRWLDGRVDVESGPGVITPPTNQAQVKGAGLIRDLPGRILSDHYGLLADLSITY